MGCTLSRTVSDEEAFCTAIYDKFKTGKIKAIIDAATEDATFNAEFDSSVPYAGTYKGKEEIGVFFEKVGKAWGGPKGCAIEFTPHDFKIKEKGVIENFVTIKQLTPAGKVIFGTEKHVWSGVDTKAKKWGGMTVSASEDYHRAAFDEKTSQPEILCKMAWDVFKKGQFDVLVGKLQTQDCVLSLMQDEKDKEGLGMVPYAGAFEGKDQFKAFGAMGKSWVFDEKFKQDPMNFKTDGMTVTMDVEVDITTTSGKKIKGKERHVGVCVADENGCLRLKSWTVTNGGHHVAAFK